MGPASRNPITGRYVTVVNRSLEGEKGAFVRYTDLDLDDENFTEKRIDRIDGEPKKTLKLSAAVPFGLSYLHMQTLANTRDYEGSYVRFINFSKN